MALAPLSCDASLLAYCAAAPLLFALSRQSFLGAALLAGAAAAAVAWITSGWLPGVLRDGLGATWWGAAGAWLLLGSLAFPLAALFGAAVRALGPATWLFAPGVAVGWALVELGYARVFPGLPWLALGAPLIDTPLAPLGAVLGVHGASGLVLGAHAVLAQAVASGGAARALGGALALGLVTALALRIAPPPAERSAGATLRVAFVQPGLAMAERLDPGFAGRNLTALIEASPVAAAPDLIVWPESAFVTTVEGRPLLRDRVARFVAGTGIPVLAGAYRRAGDGLHASAVWFEPGAEPRPVHDKRRLVPLAESVPAWVSPAIRRALGRMVPSLPIESGGDRAAPGPTPFGVAVLLCHEAAFSGAVADPAAPLLANLANDGWYDRTAGAAQQLRLARWRAVESGAPLVRAAATGVSAWIDPTGAVRERIAVGEVGARTVALPLAPVLTPFERLGYGPLAGAALVILGCAARRRRRPAPRQETP